MAISVVQSTSGGANAPGNASQATSNFAGSCTSGDWIIFGVRWAPSPTISSITDTLGTVYNLAVGAAATIAIAIYYGQLTASGTNALTVNWSANASFRWIYASQVSGLASSSPLDITDSTSAINQSDLQSNPLTTSQDEEIIFCYGTHNASLTYTAGTDFTLLDGSIPAAVPGTPEGGAQYRITSSALSSYTAHMTASTTANTYRLLTASFKGAAAGGQPTMRRWGGTPFVGGQGMKGGSASGNGRMWGRRNSGVVVPRHWLGDEQKAA